MRENKNEDPSVFQKAFKKSFKKLHKKVKKKGFFLLSFEEVLKRFFKKGMKKPKRADVGNLLQRQYAYDSPTGYTVYMHTGVRKGKFAEKGSAWVMVVDREKEKLRRKNPDSGIKEKVFVREFYRTLGSDLPKKLLAYALFCKNIADARPEGSDLCFVIEDGKSSENDMQWSSEFSSTPFDASNHLGGLSAKEEKIIKEGESARKRYRLKTEGKVRREKDFRSTWTE